MEEEEDYRDVLTKNYCQFSRLLVPEEVMDQLISADVLRAEDKEVISNQYLHPSRRQKANKFIDILMTRGPDGYNKFIEVLEYQNPHLYKIVSGKEPRPPPADYVTSSRPTSYKLQMLEDLPDLAQHIKDQFHYNTELDMRLSVLQQLLELGKQEKIELELEVESLKNTVEKNKNVEEENRILEKKLINAEAEVSTYMAKSLHYIETRDQASAKSEETQVKYDELYKKYLELEESKGKSQPGTAKPATKQKPEVPERPTPTADNHIHMKLNILREELNDYKAHSEDLGGQLQMAEANISQLEKDNQKVRDKHSKMEIEKKSLEKQLLEASVKLEEFFKTVQKKDEEILELQQNKMMELKKYNDLTKDRSKIFVQKYDLERKVEILKVELDKCKARNSNSSTDSNNQLSTGASGSDEDSGDQEAEEYFVNRPISDFDIDPKHPKLRRHRRALRQKSIPQRDDGDELCHLGFKSSTLPQMGTDTSRWVFEEEVAHFRNTMSREPLGPSTSLIPNEGSFIDRSSGPHGVNLRKLWTSHSSTKRQPISNPPDSEDNDGGSSSTILVARTGQVPSPEPRSPGMEDRSPGVEARSSEVKKQTSFRVAELPKGGKKFIKQPSRKENVLADRQPTSLEPSSPSCIGDMSDFPSHQVYKILLPKSCKQVMRAGMLDSNMCRNITLKVPIIGSKIEIHGGNHTGIYISKVMCKSLGLIEGQEIRAIIYTPNDKAESVVCPLKGCVLQDALRMLSEEYIRKKKEKEVKLRVRHCAEEYQSARKWMVDHEESGDNIYIRCNVPMESKSGDEISLKPGDVVLVRNTTYSPDKWSGFRVDTTTGRELPDKVVIPNAWQANVRRVQPSEGISQEDSVSSSLSRRGCVKVRGQAYDRVLPMKAAHNLPVYIYGASSVVDEILQLVNGDSRFIVDNSDNGASFDNHSEQISDTKKYFVRRGRTDKIKLCLQRIIVFIRVTTDTSPHSFRTLFGSACELNVTNEMVAQCTSQKRTLCAEGINFEELCLDDLKSQEALLETLSSRVKSSQDRLLWLNSSEMDPTVADEYPQYLGQKCDPTQIGTFLTQASVDSCNNG